MTNFMYYSRLYAARDMTFGHQGLTFGHQGQHGFRESHVWMDRWLSRNLTTYVPDNIPSQVTVGDCRHLFRLESEVAGMPVVDNMFRPPVVVVGNREYVLCWSRVLSDTVWVCRPV